MLGMDAKNGMKVYLRNVIRAAHRNTEITMK